MRQSTDRISALQTNATRCAVWSLFAVAVFALVGSPVSAAVPVLQVSLHQPDAAHSAPADTESANREIGPYPFREDSSKVAANQSTAGVSRVRMPTSPCRQLLALFWMPQTSMLLGNLAAIFLAVAGMSIERGKREA